MFVWSKRLVGALLGLFVLMLGIVLLNRAPDNTSDLTMYTTGWMALNYIGLILWVFVWMIVRGTHARVEKIGFEKYLSVGDRDNVRRNVSGDVAGLSFDYWKRS